MHTFTMIVTGLALLALCGVCGRMLAGGAGLSLGTRIFLPLWAVIAVGNLVVGVTQAGYTVAEELPVLAAIFLVPAAAALLILRRTRRAAGAAPD